MVMPSSPIQAIPRTYRIFGAFVVAVARSSLVVRDVESVPINKALGDVPAGFADAVIAVLAPAGRIPLLMSPVHQLRPLRVA